MREAMFYEKLEDMVNCHLCPQDCKIPNGGIGFCRVRKNIAGKLYSLNYGRITAIAMDPVEKKPLYHFYPGKFILSVGSFGCNFKCGFCQNWTIAHGDPEAYFIEPDKLVRIALNEKNNIGIAYTYNEPSIWYEFVIECAKKARDVGLKNVLVTNGYISEAPLLEILPYIDAMNIDVKAFNEKFYRNICKGNIENVKRTVEIAHSRCHIELTTLVIPDFNDDEKEMEEMFKWVSSLNPNIPHHLSRFYPNYKMSGEITPLEKLIRIRDIAKRYLNYVYIGNVPGIDNNSYCPRCGNLLVKRIFYDVEMVGLKGDRCENCKKIINIEC